MEICSTQRHHQHIMWYVYYTNERQFHSLYVIDIKLLEACKVELHRRLKAYHAWRDASTSHSSHSSQRLPILAKEAGQQSMCLSISHIILQVSLVLFLVVLVLYTGSLRYHSSVRHRKNSRTRQEDGGTLISMGIG